MEFTVTKVTFALQGKDDGYDITESVFDKNLIPQKINKNEPYSKVITHHDIMPDPYPVWCEKLQMEGKILKHHFKTTVMIGLLRIREEPSVLNFPPI